MLDYLKLADDKHGFLTKPLRWSWGRLGGRLGPSWSPLGAVLDCLGHFGGRPGAVFVRLGVFWGRLGAILGYSGPSWGRLGFVFNASATYQRHAE